MINANDRLNERQKGFRSEQIVSCSFLLDLVLVLAFFALTLEGSLKACLAPQVLHSHLPMLPVAVIVTIKWARFNLHFVQ